MQPLLSPAEREVIRTTRKELQKRLDAAATVAQTIRMTAPVVRQYRTLVFAPVLVVLSLWLYTLIFAFAACWFAHYALAELDRLRQLPPAGGTPLTVEAQA